MARRKRNRKENGGFNVWRSYSDMMAGVVLLFVLIMCVTLFQAQRSYAEKLAEQEQRIRIQDEYAAEMAKKQEELAEQDALLSQQKEKLAEQNLTLDEMQAALDEQARILSDKQATLEEQETVLAQQRATMEKQQATVRSQQDELDKKQATVEAQQKQLKAQAEEISAKTKELKEKQAQIDRIVGVKAELIEALQREFAAGNVNVNIDTQTGAMMLDARVMFDFDSATLSEEGKEVLRQVLPIYCRVLLSNEFKDNVAEIMIDGYTDTSGSYEYNLELSQERSLAVADFLLETEGEFLSAKDSQTLREILTVSGHSWNNPILDAQGNIDMDASRRVEVKFRLKDEEMIEELRDLTE